MDNAQLARRCAELDGWQVGNHEYRGFIALKDGREHDQTPFCFSGEGPAWQYIARAVGHTTDAALALAKRLGLRLEQLQQDAENNFECGLERLEQDATLYGADTTPRARHL